MRILVAGGRGQLGSDLAALSTERNRISAPDSREMDITDPDSIRTGIETLIKEAKGDVAKPVIINAAAYTAVDKAETEVEKACAVNAIGAQNLAMLCARWNIPLIHVSTDYVFSGMVNQPYEPDDPTDPQTTYGKSKLLGEHYVLREHSGAVIARTAWLYGWSGHNFVKTMMRLEQTRDTVSVVDDQVGCPTWSGDVAAGLLELAQLMSCGQTPLSHRIVHCTSSGQTTWYGFAKAVFAEVGADPNRVQPCTTAGYPLPAPRPAYSVLGNSSWLALGLAPLRDWRSALAAAFTKQGFSSPKPYG